MKISLKHAHKSFKKLGGLSSSLQAWLELSKARVSSYSYHYYWEAYQTSSLGKQKPIFLWGKLLKNLITEDGALKVAGCEGYMADNGCLQEILLTKICQELGDGILGVC